MWRDGDPLPESINNEDSERRYKLEQQQRKLENAVRKAKRKVEGLSDPENVKKAKAELRDAQKQLKDFINKVNADEGETILKRDYGREKVYSDIPKNRIDNSSESGIIKHIREEIIPSMPTDKLVLRQAIHREGTTLYEKRKSDLMAIGQYGPSYITISDEKILELVNQFKGTGGIKVNKRTGKWDNEETILTNDTVVGIVVNNLNGKTAETTVFRIHYSNSGVHIVPDYPSKKRKVSQK